jgi:hypothetical protein
LAGTQSLAERDASHATDARTLHRQVLGDIRRKAAYDAELQLSRQQENVVLDDELSIAELVQVEDAGVCRAVEGLPGLKLMVQHGADGVLLSHPCRCGDAFITTMDELMDGSFHVIVQCR